MKIVNKTYSDKYWMKKAIFLAKKAEYINEVPIGALIVLNNKIIGSGYNSVISNNDPTAHAEIIAIKNSSLRIKNYRLLNTTLYVTLEPCIMCIGAIINSKIKKLVYGSYYNKDYFFEKINNNIMYIMKKNKIKINSGILNNESSNLLQNFFKKLRIKNKLKKKYYVNK